MPDWFKERDAMRERMGIPEAQEPDDRVWIKQDIERRRREEEERAKAALDARAAAAPKNSVELAGQTAQQARGDAIDQARAIDSAKRNVRVANRFYEADKRLTDEAEGVTSVRPVMDPVTGEPMLRPVFDEAGNVMRNADGSPQVEMVTESVESPGFIERQRTTQDAAGQESIRAEQRLSDVMDEQTRATDMAMVDQSAREFAYDERLRSQEEAVQRSNQLVSDATARLTQFADDPWQDKGAGFKTLAVLQGVLSGLVGQDATRVLQQAINTEMDGLRSAVSSSQGSQNAALDTYRTILAETENQRQADLMMEAARLEAARAEFLQKQQEFGIPVLSAQHQAFLADLDEMIAQKHNQAQRMAAANVPFTTRTVSTMGRAERMAREKMIGQDIKTAGDATAAGIGQAGALEMEGVKQSAKRDEAASKAGKGKLPEKLSDERMRRTRRLMDRIDKVMKRYDDTGDVPGRGAGTYAFGEGADVKAELDAIVEDFGRIQSGGAITDDERAAFEDAVYRGYTDERLITNLQTIKDGLVSEMEQVYRTLTPEERQRIAGTGMLPEFSPDLRGQGGSAQRGQSVVQED